MGESDGKVGHDGTIDLSVSPIMATEGQIIAKLYNGQLVRFSESYLEPVGAIWSHLEPVWSSLIY